MKKKNQSEMNREACTWNPKREAGADGKRDKHRLFNYLTQQRPVRFIFYLKVENRWVDDTLYTLSFFFIYTSITSIFYPCTVCSVKVLLLCLMLLNHVIRVRIHELINYVHKLKINKNTCIKWYRKKKIIWVLKPKLMKNYIFRVKIQLQLFLKMF